MSEHPRAEGCERFWIVGSADGSSCRCPASSVPPTQPPAAPETDVSALRVAWSTRAAEDGWLDPDGARLVGAAVNAIAWQLLEDSMDLADRDPSAEMFADAQSTASALLADLSAARERVREVENERDRLQRWKDEALPVIFGLQDLGRALGLRLGTSITGPDAVETARNLTARAESAEAAHDALRAGVEALAEKWEGWSKQRSTTRIDTFRDAAEDLRALLAGDAS